MSLYGLANFKLFWNPSTHTKALLAWNGDTAVLAFRGTVSLTNAFSDLQVGFSQQCQGVLSGVGWRVNASSKQHAATLPWVCNPWGQTP